MVLVDNSEESKSLLKYFREQAYREDNKEDIDNIREICILTAYCFYKVFFLIAGDEKTRNIFLNAKVKIIIGLKIDNNSKKIYFSNNEYNEDNKNKDNKEAINDFKEYTLSEKENYKEVIKLFKEKCQNGSLEIRKSQEDTHSKLYLFKYDEESNKSQYVIGSSNFTHFGVKERKELNISGQDGFEKLYKYFEEEWNKASPILDNGNQDDFFNGIIEKKNDKKNKEDSDAYSPYKIFLKTVYEYFEFRNGKELLISPKNYGYDDYKYQIDAIKSAINGVLTYDGVLISDVVGLGKSVIASAAAKNILLMEEVKETIIICPPKIIYSWENYSKEFELKAKIFSIGLLDKALEYIRNNRAERLVIVDEAHRFVNGRTASHDTITQICMGNKVMLLTATPMHNTTSDIFSIVDIFDKVLTKNKNVEEEKRKILKKEREIKSEFKKSDFSKEENIDKIKEISKSVISLINPIIIRRTRKDLLEDSEYRKDLEKQKTEFNDVEDPKLHDYRLGELSKLYSDTLEKISPYNEELDGKDDKDDKDKDNLENKENIFKGVRYKPLTYLKKGNMHEKKESDKIVKSVYGEDANFDFADMSSNNISKFMRNKLVRRFESSICAFKKSVDNMIDKYENIKNWINKNRYPIYKKGNINYSDLFYNDDDDYEYEDEEYDFENEKYIKSINTKSIKRKELEDKGLYIIENIKEVLSEDFFESFENDLRILKDIRKDWENIGVDKDKKFIKLIEELKSFKEENDKRKIIIFSEFKDTVNYLYESIKKDEELNDLFKPLKSSSDSKNRETVSANFDASLEESKQEDEHFLLISTDTLSEGVNLHRAGVIINYDIPYNPTRVIQRVGRINRIGKKLFDKIYIHNFIPRLEAQKDIKNWQISNFKLTLINAIFGNDTKILQKEDEINSLFSIKRELETSKEESSWDIEYKEIYNKLKEDEELLEEIKNLEYNDKAFIRRESDFNGLLEIRKGKYGIFGGLLKNSVMDYNIENIFKCLKAEEKEKSFEPSENAKSLAQEFERKRNIKKGGNKPNALILLEKYRDDMRNNIFNNGDSAARYNDIEYIEKIIKALEYGYCSKKQIRDIEKCFPNNGDNNELLKSIKNIIDDRDIPAINYIEKDIFKDSEIIAKEEFERRI